MKNTEKNHTHFRWDEPEGDFSRHLVEFAARGVDLKVPWKRGKWTVQSGSSFAAPHVSGLLSRLLSVHPSLKPPVAKALLQEIAQPWSPAMRGPNH